MSWMLWPAFFLVRENEHHRTTRQKAFRHYKALNIHLTRLVGNYSAESSLMTLGALEVVMTDATLRHEDSDWLLAWLIDRWSDSLTHSFTHGQTDSFTVHIRYETDAIVGGVLYIRLWVYHRGAVHCWCNNSLEISSSSSGRLSCRQLCIPQFRQRRKGICLPCSEARFPRQTGCGWMIWSFGGLVGLDEWMNEFLRRFSSACHRWCCSGGRNVMMLCLWVTNKL